MATTAKTTKADIKNLFDTLNTKAEETNMSSKKYEKFLNDIDALAKQNSLGDYLKELIIANLTK